MHRTHIRANQPWWTANWKEFAHYRDLLWFLVRRDFTTLYKQTILGPVWYVLQPVATTLVFTVVFGKIAGIGTDGVPPFLFYRSGMLLWTFFQGCLMDISNTFIGNTHLFGKVYFPRLIIPAALVAKNSGQLILNVLLFLGFYAYYIHAGTPSIHPTPWLAYLPILILQSALAGLGAGLWLAALTAKYRDLRFMLALLAQLWMFATPIVWSASKATDQQWRWILLANPMAGPVVFNRIAFLGVGNADLTLLCSSLILSILLAVSGILLFNKVQRTFIDTV
jgi:lipopolysaccharide transport system permease protein